MKKIERGEMALYMNCFQNIKTFSGISGKGQVIIIDNMDALGKVSKSIVEAEQHFIKTLQTKNVKQAGEIIQKLLGKDLSESEDETLVINQAVLNKAEADLNKFKAEYYSVKVEMPMLEKISHEDFYVLAEKNAISPEEAKQPDSIGLYPQGIAILKSLIY